MNILDLICENLISVSWVKILKFFNADPDPGSNPGSEKGKKSDPGWKKIGSGILDKHPGSATPLGRYVCKT
jgi:hypothetical protein